MGEKLITEKWLLEKGFSIQSYEGSNTYYLKGGEYLWFVYCDDFSLSISDNKNNDGAVLIDHSLTIYEYQFENIYYCLTGKEL